MDRSPPNLSTKALASENPQETPRTSAVRELMRLLVKTQKAHRLYDARNAVAERLESELFERLGRFVTDEGEIHLVVQESQLRSEDEVVYESSDRNDSLAFLLYRDGIRRLSFGAGLELEELRAFLSCLNRVALLSNDQDDLVTLLWEQDFHAIRYFAIEELSENESYPRLQDQLATSAGREGSGGEPGEAVSLDLEQPVSTVPVEACRLEAIEIEALQQELASEEKAPFRQNVSELALELVLLETDEAAQAEIGRNLLDIVERLIADGDLFELAGIHEHVDGLATMVFRAEAGIQKLASDLTRALSEPKRIEAILEMVESVHAPKPDTLTAFLVRLGPSTGASLLPWMGRFSSPAYRRAVTSALLFFEGGGLSILDTALPLGGPPEDPKDRMRHRQFVREAVHAISRHGASEALPRLERLLKATDPETRRESFVAATRYGEEGVLTLCLERVADGDSEVRQVALDTLVRRGRPELGLLILERSLANPRFREHSLNEKRRLFAAVAKITGEAALDPFRRLLLAKEDRWFASQKDRQFAEAAAHGIRVVGTPGARRILEECAQNGPRLARAACARELEGGKH
jgi:HEAT repeats